MPITFLPDAHTMEIIELQPGQIAPDGAPWVNIEPYLGGCWYMDGSLPEPREMMQPWGEYRRTWQAVEAAIAYAHKVKVRLLYIEIDARRC